MESGIVCSRCQSDSTPCYPSLKPQFIRYQCTSQAAFLFEYHGFRVYFGDNLAMGSVSRQTGHKYGPFDLALIEIGAYAPRKLLRSVHASPENTVETGEATKVKSLLGIHWGTIKLSQANTFEPAH
ncbi:MAG: MBL fold metallo-hydrolase [Pseudomonadota bacterium]|nr:MBL fold metallo-hydrolase [Pseudomonadota bacterium]